MGSDNPLRNAPPAAEASPRPRFDYSEGAPVVQARSTSAQNSSSALRIDAIIGFEKPWGILFAVAFAILFYQLYANNLAVLVSLWYNDSGWSHGFFVPVLSAYLIYLRWDELSQLKVKAAWQGLAILFIGVIGQVLFAATGTTHMTNLSMLVVLTGATLWILGWDFMRILWLPISYLVFAINPPGELYQRITEPMQWIAANIASKMLMIINVPSEPRGTTLEIIWNGVPKQIDVAQACSGMRMLIAFIALAVVLAYSSHRAVWQRIFLAVCAIPVAILCNGLRVAIISYLVAQDPNENSAWAHGAAHGYVGLAMLIPAMLLQLAIAWVLDRIFVEVPGESNDGNVEATA